MDFLKDLRKLFFPRNLTCSVCKRENFNGRTVCDKCEGLLPKNDANICDHCGRKTPFPIEYCDYCKGRRSNVDCSRSAFEYLPPISDMIRDFKFYGKKYLAEEFAERLARVYQKSLPVVDAVVSVPSSKDRIKLKGYNQSEVLAKEVAEKTEVYYADGLIEKVRNTSSQVGLTGEERAKNLKGSFRVADKAFVKGKRFLIVDDVMTTGTTLETVAEILKKAGASEVYGITVCSVTMQNGNKLDSVYNLSKTPDGYGEED